MTKSMRLALLCFYAFALASALSSCHKDGGSKPSASKTELVTQSAWKIEKSGVDADKNGSIDIADTWDACQSDNSYLFKTGGTGTFDEGASKCDPADPQSGDFAWSFKNQETILSAQISQIGLAGDATISILNATTLEVYSDVTLPGLPTPVRYIIRFKH